MGTPWKGSTGYLLLDGDLELSDVISVTPSASANNVVAPATWARGKVTIPGTPDFSFTVKMADNDTHSEFLAVVVKARAQQASGTAIAVDYGPRGDTAGRLRMTGTVYISEPVMDSGGVEGTATFEFQMNFTAPPTMSKILTLANLALTETQAGVAYSGVNVVASGGTAAYTYAVDDGLPLGLAINSGGVVSGTPNAGLAAGTYRFRVTVTDGATPAVVQTFWMSIAITAA